MLSDAVSAKVAVFAQNCQKVHGMKTISIFFLPASKHHSSEGVEKDTPL